MTELRPEVADMDPRLVPLSEQAFDLAGVDVVVNTHLHFDHCGGNHLFAGRPIYVQRQELDDALGEEDYTIREWVEAPGVEYVAVDGELELLPGLRLVPTPGHTRGSQVVVVETDDGPVDVSDRGQDLALGGEPAGVAEGDVQGRPGAAADPLDVGAGLDALGVVDAHGVDDVLHERQVLRREVLPPGDRRSPGEPLL